MTEAQGFMIIGTLWAILAVQQRTPKEASVVAAFVALVNITLAMGVRFGGHK